MVQGWVLCSHPLHIFSLSFASSRSPDFTNLSLDSFPSSRSPDFTNISLDSSMLWVYWKAICIRLDQETHNVLLTSSPFLQTFSFKIVFPVSKHMIVSFAHGKSPRTFNRYRARCISQISPFLMDGFLCQWDNLWYIHNSELANYWRMDSMYLFRSHDLQLVDLLKNFCTVYVLISFTINLIQPSAIWEKSLDSGIAGWPVDMSVGDWLG